MNGLNTSRTPLKDRQSLWRKMQQMSLNVSCANFFPLFPPLPPRNKKNIESYVIVQETVIIVKLNSNLSRKITDFQVIGSTVKQQENRTEITISTRARD